MPYPRPPLEVRNIFDLLLTFEYATDGPRCTFPSLHVAFAFVLWLGLRRRSRTWSVALGLNAMAIAVATILLKQHFIVDVIAGALLAWSSWKVAPFVTRRALGAPTRD